MRAFLTSPWIPAEWVRAHGVETQGIWYAETFRHAALPRPAGTCAWSENVVQFAETSADAAIIFSTACDQLRRGFDEAVFRGASRTFLFNLPATQSPAAKQLYRSELERLSRFLCQLDGTAPAPEELRAEMAATNQARRALSAAAPGADPHSFAGAIARFYSAGGFAPPLPAQPAGKVPLAIVGGPLSVPDWTVFDAIEAAGGWVALNATDTGERALCPAWGGLEDPLAALAEGYFENMADVFQRPNTRLYSWLQPRLLSRQVRGLVLWCFTGCDLWRAEMQTLREHFQLPVLLLEVDDAAGISPRDVTRLEAFVETLKQP